MTLDIASVRPTAKELADAFRYVTDAQLYFYRLLFYQEPKLTAPSNPREFAVELDHRHRHLIKFYCVLDPDYTFTLSPLDLTKRDDGDIVAQCRAGVAEARKAPSQRKKIHPNVCCSFATHLACVCTVSYRCDYHGIKRQCVGTHD